MASGNIQRKSLDQPDETRTFENGKAEVVILGDFTASRLVFEPGWRWSENVKPIAEPTVAKCCTLVTKFRVGYMSGWTTAQRRSLAPVTHT